MVKDPASLHGSQQSSRMMRIKSPLLRHKRTSTGLIPAASPDGELYAPSSTSIDGNTSSAAGNQQYPSALLTVGITLLLVAAVAFLTVCGCLWARRRAKAKQASSMADGGHPWTARYRLRKSWDIDTPKNNKGPVEGDSDSLDQHCVSIAEEKEFDETIYSSLDAKTLSVSLSKRKSFKPDEWGSPTTINVPPIARASPRMQTSHKSIGGGGWTASVNGHLDGRKSESVWSNIESAYDGLYARRASCAVSDGATVGLGVLSNSEGGHSSSPWPEDSGDPESALLWQLVSPSKQDKLLICSADKYVQLMPRQSVVKRAQSNRGSCIGRSLQGTSKEDSIGSLSYESFAFLRSDDHNTGTTRLTRSCDAEMESPQEGGDERTTPAIVGRRRQSSCSRLLDEIFDESTDARVTSTFTRTMQSLRDHRRYRMTRPLPSKSVPIASRTSHRKSLTKKTRHLSTTAIHSSDGSNAIPSPSPARFLSLPRGAHPYAGGRGSTATNAADSTHAVDRSLRRLVGYTRGRHDSQYASPTMQVVELYSSDDDNLGASDSGTEDGDNGARK